MSVENCETPKETCHPILDELYFDFYDTFIEKETTKLRELHEALWNHRQVNSSTCLCKYITKITNKTKEIQDMETQLMKKLVEKPRG